MSAPHALAFPALITGRGLDAVKILAAVLMLADHINYTWWDGASFGVYLAGRLAFPLFCFAAACALLRDGADQRHLYRQAAILLAFAVISEPVSWLARDYDKLNVLFTLSFAIVVAPWMLSAGTMARLAAYGAAVVSLAWPSLWEFGMAGVLLPAAIALAMQGRRLDLWAGMLMAAAMNFGGYAAIAGVAAGAVLAVALASTVLPVIVLQAMNAALVQMPAVWRAGRLVSRYALHLFYPLHLLALWAIARVFLG